MTPEELKEIEERFSKASPFLIGINGKIFFNLIGQKDLSEDEILPHSPSGSAKYSSQTSTPGLRA